MITIQQILEEFKKNNPLGNITLIQRSYQLALKNHEGQKRVSGEDYISHCLCSAKTLVSWGLDSETIAAALLHDVLDDTPVTPEQLEKECGKNVLKLVEGVCKTDKIVYQGSENERMAENFRRLILATAQDIRVILIKLADRLHNMQTLAVLSDEKQKRIAIETLEIYAPIANRLCMGKLKGQLEDLSFPYTHPKEYQWIIDNVGDEYQERERYLKKSQMTIEQELKKADIKIIDIHSRTKHQYSLYKKLLRYDMDLDKIYDLVALRIIVPSIKDCYAALGALHKIWKPLPGRIKDYIALPKPNGYQSIHTTVFTPDGRIIEVQIRTDKMHQKTEYGIAAHWYYSEQKGLKKYIKKILPFHQIPLLSREQTAISPPTKELSWIKQLQKWQRKEFDSPEEFFKSLKIDFFKDRIFVFTPEGDVIELPEEATAVDFAYQIHTDIGHHCSGVKIDGKLSALNQPLMNGQIVKIITEKNKNPSRDWLRFIKTNQARSNIKAYFKKTSNP